VVAPNVITLFRIPPQEDFRHPDELVSEIQRTVIHELAHHAGIDDERLDELGYA
jgi:predicted Zn-dependent protease with MMP-like domain